MQVITDLSNSGSMVKKIDEICGAVSTDKCVTTSQLSLTFARFATARIAVYKKILPKVLEFSLRLELFGDTFF